MKKLTALTGCGQTHPKPITSGILVNGLPIELVRQWTEYPTKQSFAVSVSTEVRRQYYLNDAAFSEAMREAGYLFKDEIAAGANYTAFAQALADAGMLDKPSKGISKKTLSHGGKQCRFVVLSLPIDDSDDEEND